MIKQNVNSYNMKMLIPQIDNNSQSKYGILILIMQFWLSGLWILSLIFTVSDQQQLENINMYMFITLGIGSLIGGYLSDIFNRILIFKYSSILWLISSIIVIFNMQIGYIIAAGAIGLLNNLTFVIIMEKWQHKKDLYTIYVLIGWAVSQITLGIVFYGIQDKVEIYYIVLFVLTLIYNIGVFLLLPNHYKQKQNNIQQQQQQSPQQTMKQPLNQQQIQPYSSTSKQQQVTTQLQQKQSIPRRLLPHSILPLIGGCILMFVMQMFYYRTQFTLDRFGVSLQLNTIIVGCTQVIANLIFTKFINRYPRNAFLRIFIILLAGLFFGLVFISNKVVQTLIQGIMRLFDTCIMIVLGVYIPELFNQDQRGKGTNYIMSFGVLGSALNSVILKHFQFWQLIFFLLLGFLATFGFKEKLSAHQNLEEQQRSPRLEDN